MTESLHIFLQEIFAGAAAFFMREDFLLPALIVPLCLALIFFFFRLRRLQPRTSSSLLIVLTCALLSLGVFYNHTRELETAGLSCGDEKSCLSSLERRGSVAGEETTGNFSAIGGSASGGQSNSNDLILSKIIFTPVTSGDGTVKYKSGDLMIKSNGLIRIQTGAIGAREIENGSIQDADIDDDIDLTVETIYSRGTMEAGGDLIIGGNTIVTNGQINVGDKVITQGDIGVGISVPLAKLHVHQTSPSGNEVLFLISTGDDSSRFSVDEDGDVAMDGALTMGGDLYIAGDEIHYGTDTDNTVSRIDADNLFFNPDNEFGYTQITGALRNSTSAYFAVLSGNVGIGTANPGVKLDVNAGWIQTSNQYGLAVKDSGGTGRIAVIIDASNNLQLGDNNTLNAITFLPGSTEKMRLTSAGDLELAGIITGATWNGAVIADGYIANDITLANLTQITSRSHSDLQNLLADDHTQYALLAGRSGGQTLIGGSAASETLTLQSTSHATKGKILFGTSAYDEVNNRLGIGTTSPSERLHLGGGTLRIEGPTGYYGTITEAAGNFAINSSGSGTAITFSGTGTERMRIGNSGNVGIGTTSPNVRFGQKLDIATSATYGGMSLSTWSTTASHSNLLDFNKSSSATIGTQSIIANGESLGSLVFRGSDGTAFINASYILGEVDGTPGTNDMPGRLVFATTADGASVSTERMRINSAGNVGIGTTSPTSKLLVTDNNADLTQIALSNTGANDPTKSVARLLIGSNYGDALTLYNASAGTYRWATGIDVSAGNAYKISNSNALGTSDLVTILTSGNVGIGTTSPTNILSLGNTTAQKFWIENSATDVVGSALTVAAGGTVAGTSVADRLGGNLILQSGLGTGTGASTISFQTGTTLTTGLTLQTMSTKMTILGNGNVGIGTTAPNNKLTIQTASDVAYSSTGISENGISLFNIGTGNVDGVYSSLRFRASDDSGSSNAIGAISLIQPVHNGATSDMAFQLRAAAGTYSEIMRLQSTGNVGIGTTSPGSLLHILKNQDAATALTIQNNTNGTAALAGIILDSDSGNSYIQQRATSHSLNPGKLLIHADVNTTGMKLETADASDPISLNSVMTIINGNVGIGTTDPTSRIHGVTTLSADTGDEIAYQLNYTTNKATSGNDTGLLINMTDTLSPGTSNLLDLQVGGVSKFSVNNGGTVRANDGIGIFYGSLISPSTANLTLGVQAMNFSSSDNAIEMATGTFSGAGVAQNAVVIKPTYNQTTTSSATDLLINRTQTAVGSGLQRLIDAQVGGTSKFSVSNAGSVFSLSGYNAISGNSTLHFQNQWNEATANMAWSQFFQFGEMRQTTGTNQGLLLTPTFALSGGAVSGDAISQVLAIKPTYNQSGTQANTDLLINRTQTAVGSGAQLLIDAQVGGVSKFSVSNTGIISTATWNSAAIGADYGGTGQTVYAVGDLLYASTTTALSKLADVATGSVLISGGVGTAPSWGALSSLDHGSLGGLTDDDHSIYALLAGRSGGQTLIGGTAAGETLTLQSTSHATKGKILFGTSAYDEVNNRLGIGTTSPGMALDIIGSGNAMRAVESSSATSGARNALIFGATSSGTIVDGYGPRILFSINAHNNGGITLLRSGDDNYGKMNFETSGADGSLKTRMTIDNSGNVGIGTASPAFKLDIFGGDFYLKNDVAGGANLYLATGAANADAAIDLNTATAGNTGRIYLDESDSQKLKFKTDADALTIDRAGNVGIGTTGPAEILDITKSTASGLTAIALTNGAAANTANKAGMYYTLFSDTQSRQVFQLRASFNTLTDASRNSLVEFQSANAGTYGTVMAINGGNVGIGTTSPGYKLDIAGSQRLTNNQTIYFRNASNDGDYPVVTYDSGDIITFGGTASTNGLQFKTGNANPRMFIKNDGNVGIGNTSPSAMLEVGSTTAGGSLTVNATESAELAPALNSSNWTAGSGWDISTPGSFLKNADGVGTLVPNPALSISIGDVLKITITSTQTVGTFSVAAGGQTQWSPLSNNGTVTFYYTATTTGNLIITPNTTATRGTFTAISVKKITSGAVALNNGLTINGGQTLLGSGSVGKPSLAFKDYSTSGLYYNAGAVFITQGGGVAIFGTTNTGGSPGVQLGSSFDTNLVREAAGMAALKNTTNANAFTIYNTHTSGTNFERAEMSWQANANVFTIQTTKGSGGGTVRNMALMGGNVGIGIAAPTSRIHAVDTVNAGSAALAAPILELAQTWNTSGTIDGAIRLTVTDTASNAASLLMNLKVGAASMANINKVGKLTLANEIQTGGAITTTTGSIQSAGYLFTDVAICTINDNVTLRLQPIRSLTTSDNAIEMASGVYSGAGVTQNAVAILPTWNQTTTSSATDLLINRTETAVGSGAQLLIDAQVGGVSKFSVSNAGAATIAGTVTLSSVGAMDANDTYVCRDPTSGVLTTGATCTASSLRYKKNIADMAGGLNTVMQLRPVTFDWKYNNRPGLGFIAEEVEQINPVLVTYDDEGNISGLHYDWMSAILTKAVQELASSASEQQAAIAEISNSEFLISNQIPNLNDQVSGLVLKTGENISTIKELQESVDEELAKISNSSSILADRQILISNKIQNINDQNTDINEILKQVQYDNIAQDNLIAALQAQMDELKKLANQELNLARIDLNANDISFIKTLLGVDRVKNPGDIDILGKFVAEGIETGTLTVKIKKDFEIIGTAVIKTGDEEIKISSRAITEESKIFITPQTKKPVLWSVTGKKKGEFAIVIDSPQTEDVSFDWWVIDTK